MKREVAFRRIIDLLIIEVRKHKESYHHVTPDTFLEAAQAALSASPRKLDELLEAAERSLAERSAFPSHIKPSGSR